MVEPDEHIMTPSMTMKMTEFERLSLYNQFCILEKVDPDNADMYKINQKILVEGYTYNYPSFMDGFSDEMPVEESKEVLDILDMFRALYSSYKNLSNKSEINKELITFVGFDGNDEGRQYMYARFYLEELDRYHESQRKGNDYNTHYNILDTYRAMLKEWKLLGKNFNLSKEEILKIISHRR